MSLCVLLFLLLGKGEGDEEGIGYAFKIFLATSGCWPIVNFNTQNVNDVNI